jgi:hypothetical protein
VHTKEVVRARCGLDRIDRDLDVSIGAILEANGRGDARSQFPVYLAFGRAGAAPQQIRSPMYWGEMTSRNSPAAGNPRRLISTSRLRAMRRPSSMR